MADNPFTLEGKDAAHNIAHHLRVLTRTLYVRMTDQAEKPSYEGQDLVIEAATDLFVLAGRIRGHMVQIRSNLEAIDNELHR